MFWTWILQHSIAKFCSLSFLFQIQFSRSPISALLSGLIDYKINTNPEWSEIELNQFIQVTYIYSLEFIMIYLTAMPKGLTWRRLRLLTVYCLLVFFSVIKYFLSCHCSNVVILLKNYLVKYYAVRVRNSNPWNDRAHL